ncbi:MAG TPA: hypothetical protein DCY85_04595 [Firmicutes bacterium]|jgi:hypothetical protein|nr:hypothetical protein [Bacillota bacterium]HBG43438.1 hypothetical protein [Bacillota bacterium]HBL67520.1 hypothetical protein [Bacillota bacterium]HCT36786.1 hypothetical protein [Bacillota bacterium]
MNFKGLQAKWILLAALLTGALLFGGHFAYQRYATETPLRAAVLAQPGVKDFAVAKSGSGYTLEITIGPISDLQGTIESVVLMIEATGKAPITAINITDNASLALSEVYYEMHFALEEAADRGNFTQMKEQVDNIAREAGVDTVRIQVADRELYVQLHQDGHYLYRIINRSRTAFTETELASMAKGVLW